MLRIRPVEHAVSVITTRQLSTSRPAQNGRDPTPATDSSGLTNDSTLTLRIHKSQPPRAPLAPTVSKNSPGTTGDREKRLGNRWNAFLTPPTHRAQGESSSQDGVINKAIAIKDNISTEEFPTTCASAILKDFHSPYDATVVRLLREAGAHISGKTNMDEFGMGSHSINSHFGAVISAERLSVGGSSGGSAVAVRLHQRQAWAQGLRIGVPREYNISELSNDVREAWIRVLERLQFTGCTIVPISLPTTRHALSAYYILAPAEASSNLAKYDGVRYGRRAEAPDGTKGVLFSQTRHENLGEEVKRRILLGSYTLSADAVDNYFVQAQKIRRLVQEDFNRVFRRPNPLSKNYSLTMKDDGVDFIICPTAPTNAPTLEELENQGPVQSYMNDVFTVPASLAGLPAINMPSKFRRTNDIGKPRPIHAGIQLIGQYGDDLSVLAAARVGFFNEDSVEARFDAGRIYSRPTGPISAELFWRPVHIRGSDDARSTSEPR
ncbi:hypothetical protein FKW77_008728 [Venturia effusa]|uniref:Amidase domain-containing protein n=1 Tax=Venturia effusa TaxID=50376 RepID=A0A517LJF0_9PEZI|nr:hypothetical protein FKW77_008728 [Venturia effusa]